ncbi:Inorganic pyrophosphatase [Lobulomyces angularis]|nr:Inorganic pyrophosphatase [Lobulomyces angularis]
MSTYKARLVGAQHSLEHRVYIEKDGKVVSPFHDIPLYANSEKTILNMIVEIPRWTNAKLEISKEESFNPIKQDVKKGKLRYVRNCFPHHGYIWNYGAFPQTWEDPNFTHPDTKCAGDNDPLDVCEIGEAVGQTGQVKQVKVLGTMALLDEGETDWKVIAIDVNDPLASKLNDIEDVEKHLPGLLRATNEWFRIYKIPDGKPENNFAFSGEAKNKKYTNEVITECHEAWHKLLTGVVPNKTDKYSLSCSNVTVSDSPHKVSHDDPLYKSLPSESKKPANPIDPSVDKWFFISDQTRSHHHSLSINLDVTIAMKCENIRADVLDSSGELVILEHMFKKESTIWDTKGAEFLNSKEYAKRVHQLNVKKAMKQAELEMSGGKKLAKPYAVSGSDIQETEACRIKGRADVNKVSGMLHFTALGHGYWGAHTPHEAINFTHRIDQLSFGKYYPGLVNPLDNSLEFSDQHFTSFRYFIHVVPTIFVDHNRGANPFFFMKAISSIFDNEKILLTNQYAVTEHKTEMKDHGTPGVFFRYDIEPISVRITEEKASSFIHFLVRMCGICGGTFVTIGIIHSIFLKFSALFTAIAQN